MADPISFETHPGRYKHWKLEVSPNDPVARLNLAVDEDAPLRPGYTLKLNSYDLGVDLELADAVQRIRFEHPHVRSVVIGSAKDRIFCAGANIHMLAASSHPFKVNFCKFTNETRLAIEDASQHSGIKFLAACSGPTAGGGYELALACDEIVLIEDGSSTVSLPEVPLLGVLPGTGGLTRVVDKRKVRRDRADVFATLAEGIKGKRAVEWKLVDVIAPRSKFADMVKQRAEKLVGPARDTDAIQLESLEPQVSDDGIKYRHVTVDFDRNMRTATITLQATAEYLRLFRELDDALLRLRFNHEELGLIVLKSRGDAKTILDADAKVEGETRLFIARVLRRLDNTARSLFAVLDPGSCFVGTFLEIALAADRRYMLDDPNRPVHVQASKLNASAFPMTNATTRLQALHLQESLPKLMEQPHDGPAADEAGLVTVLADDLDFDDTLRLAIEERASLSPDALTGMEASFRCIGNETMDTKIFGRLSAWQNWIFTRPNSTGERGALSLYGRPERPSFDWRRT